MSLSRKIALLSANWTRWEHRLLSGGLRYADAHPRLVIRPFAPFKDVAVAAAELEAWGAEGAFGILEGDDLKGLLENLKHPIPVVNSALAGDHPGVVTVLGEFTGYLDTAIGHFRHLGLRSFGLLLMDEGKVVEERLVRPFLEFVRSQRSAGVALCFDVKRDVVWNPEAKVDPVPLKLAKWLQQLPKPVGIICPQLGMGGYLIRCCKTLGLRVPEDVAVIGSDETDLSLASEPTLTSVVLSMDQVGFEAVKHLAALLNGRKPASNMIRIKSAELTVRESTGKRRPEICDIAAAIQCIEENACRGISVDQVIRQTQRVSHVTFHRRFRESVGRSPAEAIRDRQLQEARRLLRDTELPVAMVSDLAGFSSPKILARVFQSVEHLTPREFRQQCAVKKNRIQEPTRPDRS